MAKSTKQDTNPVFIHYFFDETVSVQTINFSIIAETEIDKQKNNSSNDYV